MVDFSNPSSHEPRSASVPAHYGKRECCQQCGRRLRESESEMCGLCLEYNEQTLAAHERLYGHEDRELEQTREDERLDGVEGFWDGDGWHWYDDEARSAKHSAKHSAKD